MPARVLSEPEFDAIKAQVLQAAPEGLKEADFARYVGPALAQAIGTAEHSPAPITGSAIARFAAGAWKSLNPVSLVQGVGQAIAHPVDTLDAITEGITAQKTQAKQLASEGRYSEAAGHALASAVPLVGPAAAAAGERMASGDIAGGAGEGAGLVAGVVAPRAIAAARVPAGQAASAVGRVAEAVGTSPAAKRIGTYGAVAEAVRGEPVKAAAMAAAPYAVTAAGKGLQRVGAALQGKAPVLTEVLGHLPPAMADAILRELNAGPETAPAPAPVEPAATPAAVEPIAASAAPTARPMSPQQRLNEEAIAARRAAVARDPLPFTPKPAAPAAAEPVVAASGKMQLTAPEMKQFTRLVNQGMKLPDALAAVRAMRDLASRLGGATDADVAKVIAARR